MTWNELIPYNRAGGNKALAPLLREKGMPLNDDLIPSYGVFFWDDSGSNRIFTWQYTETQQQEYSVYIHKKEQVEKKNNNYLDQEATRTIILDEDD
jgi:hypothetical protein